MTKVLVLYYSAWGHMEQMAYAAAEGAKEAGATVDVKRVPELVPDDVAKAAHYKMDQKAPIAKPEELADYDAIILGVSTRYGAMASQSEAQSGVTGRSGNSGSSPEGRNWPRRLAHQISSTLPLKCLPGSVLRASTTG